MKDSKPAMTPSEISLSLASLHVLMLKGDLEEACEKYALPLSVFVGDSFFLIDERARMLEGLRIYRDVLHESGVQRIATTVRSIEERSDTRIRASVVLSYTNAKGDLDAPSHLQYVFRNSELAGDLKIEMVAYLDHGFPILAQRLAQGLPH